MTSDESFKVEKKFPRDLAVGLLARVLSDHQPLDEAIAARSGEIPPDMRAWVQEVTAGTLRWKGRLDLAIDSIALKKKPSGWLRRALLLGAYQLIVQERVSVARVVDETVALIKKREGQKPASFANALLRRISEQSLQWKTLEFPEHGTIQEKASWGSLPEWIWKKVSRSDGEEKAKNFALACLERPTLWMSVSEKVESLPEGWLQGPLPFSAGVDFSKEQRGLVSQREEFKQGLFTVQDLSSQYLLQEVSATVKSFGGFKTALDLCAAPGGKSVGLAWRGFQVSATDQNDSRIELLRATVLRAAPEVKIISREEVSSAEAFDLVWVDAPCSGSGILRRHPDVRWLREEKELPGLGKTQTELLREAWGKVRPGGALAYTVCSVLKEEGLERWKKAELKDAELLKSWILWPDEPPQGDGFQGILLRKPGAV